MSGKLGCIVTPETKAFHATLKLTPSSNADLPAWSRIEGTPRIGKANLTVGCCAAVAAVMRVQSELAFIKDFTPISEYEALRVYSIVGGYDPSKTQPDGYNPTDNGINPEVLFQWWKENPISGYKLLYSNAINPVDLVGLKASVRYYRGAYLAMELSLQNQNQNPLLPDGTKGSWGGHAVFDDGYIADRFDGTSWAQELSQTDSYFTNQFVVAAWALEIAKA
ncbi:MAG: hypothetical protein KGH75_01460 [Rhodospirillales bacterium]|nr:hypothetical protein [Rhodospirillales bacterium]